MPKKGKEGKEQKDKHGIRFFSSLRFRLVASFVIISVISICLVTVLSVNRSSSMLTNKVGVLMTAINDQFSLSIDNYFADFEQKAAMIYQNDAVAGFNPKTSKLNEYDTITVKDTIQAELSSVGVMLTYNDFCLVYSDNSTVGTMSTATMTDLGADSMYETLGTFITRKNTNDGWKIGYKGAYNKFYYVKRVNEDALLLISIYSTELNSILQYSQELDGMEVALVAGDEIVFSNQKSLVGKKISKEKNDRIAKHDHYTYVDANDVVSSSKCLDEWKIVTTIPKKTILSEVNQLVIYNIIIAIVCVILAGGMGAVIAISVVRPIRRMLESMKRAADGDFTAKVSMKPKQDEIGMLIASYHQMLQKMSGLIRNVNVVLDKVVESSSEVSTVAANNQEVSRNVSVAIDGISEGVARQLEDSRTSFSQLESLADSITDTIKDVDSATGSMDEAINISNTSIDRVHQLSRTTEDSMDAMRNASESIMNLQSEINNIQGFVDAILDISSDTALLALNASIEAAKAGETGRGFAVVADQIGKLAMQTETTTNQIREIVDGIYDKMETTVDAMRCTSNAMNEQSELVATVNKAFMDIVKATEEVKVCVNQISERAEGMGRQKDISLQSIDSILEVSESSSANAEEVMAITQEELSNTQALFKRSEELSLNVDYLNDALAQFTIEPDEKLNNHSKAAQDAPQE